MLMFNLSLKKETVNDSDGLAERARDYCKILNRQIYSFDLAAFARQELDREKQVLYDDSKGEAFFNDRD